MLKITSLSQDEIVAHKRDLNSTLLILCIVLLVFIAVQALLYFAVFSIDDMIPYAPVIIFLVFSYWNYMLIMAIIKQLHNKRNIDKEQKASGNFKIRAIYRFKKRAHKNRLFGFRYTTQTPRMRNAYSLSFFSDAENIDKEIGLKATIYDEIKGNEVCYIEYYLYAQKIIFMKIGDIDLKPTMFSFLDGIFKEEYGKRLCLGKFQILTPPAN